MALVFADRVQETTTTTGTGALTLGGAVAGFQTFSSALSDADTCYYGVTDGSDWEVGLGTYSAGALTRTTVQASSNAGALVDFGAGDKNVYCVIPAAVASLIETAVQVGGNISDLVNDAGYLTTLGLDGLSDATVTTPADKDLLSYNSGTGAWENQTIEGAGLQPAENGFVDRADSTISFVDGTRTFTIQPAVTDFTFFSGGTAFTKTGAENIVISDTEGEHFIYYDHSGTLQVVNSFSIDIIISYAFVALIYWDADNNTAITLADERHGNTMDSATHLYNHETFGTRYGGGLQVSDLDTDGTGDLDVHAQFSVSGGTIWDEDIEFTIPSVAVGVADIDFFYHDGAAGNWRRIAGNGFVTPDNGANRARYNNPDAGGAGVWGLTEVTNNDFLCMHLLATDCILSPFFLIIGQAEYSSLANARAGAGGELLSMDLGGLPSREYKAVATFIVQTSTGYSNTVASRIRTTDTGEHYIDWRSTQTGIAASVISAGLQNAAQVPFTPAGSIAATDVQTALEELDTEKQAAGSYATLTGAETLTNKTATGLVLDGGYSEETYTLTGTTPALDPSNGTIQTWALTGNSTPTDALADGECMSMLISDGSAYSITWPTMTWVGGSAPTLPTTGFAWVTLEKVGATLYGIHRGDSA